MALDIFTEPEEVDLEALRNLGPLAPLAGIWAGQGQDKHLVAGGPKEEPYRERIVFEPIDLQLGGPQLVHGPRCPSTTSWATGCGTRGRGRSSRPWASRAAW